ncbi:MAG: glycosyltransferase family 4 protein [Thermoanaerobaculia bacterium]
MTRALLLCPEPLGHRHPAGVGIRFIEIARALRAVGHQVIVLSPDGGTVDGCTSAALSPQAIHDHSGAAAVAIVQGHVVNELIAHGASIPTVVDLYDPFIVENLHYYPSRGAEVFNHDHLTLMRSLLRGDFFLCASEAQRMFYLGLLLATGRVHPLVYQRDPSLRSLLAIAPFGVAPPPPADTHPAGANVLFGGIYDWYDPILAIDAAEMARARIPGLTLTFTLHPNQESTPQTLATAAQDEVKRRGLADVVRFEPWFAYEERAAFYRKFSLAMLCFAPSLETDLAMRTRIFDYLWGGLPVITSPAGGTDTILGSYSAGVVVRSNRATDFADAIAGVLSSEDEYRRMREGARRWTTDHPWSRTLAPLLDFCSNPKKDETKDLARPLEARLPESTLLRRIRRRLGALR